MEKVTIDLTREECIDIYGCIQRRVDTIANKCIRLQNLIDKTDPTSKEYEDIKDEIDYYLDGHVYYTDLMMKLKEALQ